MTQPPQPPQPPDGPMGPPTGENPHAQQPGDGYAYPAGSLPQEPPKKRNTGVLTAIVIGAVLVLAGGGTGVYFLTKGDDTPSAGPSSPNVPSFEPPSSPGEPSDPSSEPKPPQSEAERQAPPTTTTTPPAQPPTNAPPPNSGGGDDAKILEIARKYADAVTKQDENAAKAVTCEKDTGLLYSSSGRVEVTGNPQKYTEDSASVPVKITIEQAEPFEDLPLFIEKRENRWCVA